MIKTVLIYNSNIADYYDSYELVDIPWEDIEPEDIDETIYNDEVLTFDSVDEDEWTQWVYDMRGNLTDECSVYECNVNED